MDIYSYRKLIAYQKAKVMVCKVYDLVEKFPSVERYAMCDQLRRAAVSVTSNIAEGVNRFSAKEKIRFLEISYTSLMEVSSQLDIACSRRYITQDDLDNMDIMIEEVARLISGLQKSYMRSQNSETTPNSKL